MALPDGSVGNTQISMGQMRTEFRNDNNPILMSQLYKGGGLVPATQSGTSTSTVGASVANLTGSAVIAQGQGAFSVAFSQQARFTSNMTCGNNGNVTANGNIVFTSGGSGSGDNAAVMGVLGGVRICHVDAVVNSAGTISNASHIYKNFTSSTFVSTSSTTTSASCTVTIPNGTALDIPNGVTSFKIMTFISVTKNPTGQNESSASSFLNNPSSGAFTSTTTTSTTTNINGSVPTGSVGDTEFQFSDMYGAFDV